MTAANFGLAFLAGTLSILSPCVLPLVPIVLGTAASEHRYGPAALAAGLALSFTAIGIFVATIGFAAGLNTDLLRPVAAVLLIAAGALLLSDKLQRGVTAIAAPLTNWIDARFGRSPARGVYGQFGLGLLLGAMWSPCVGPTLGAASLLAAQGENLTEVAVTMACFGIGAAIPLLLLGTLSRHILTAWRGRLISAGTTMKTIAGVVFIAAGVLVVSGADKKLETVLVDASPEWLTRLTTRF